MFNSKQQQQQEVIEKVDIGDGLEIPRMDARKAIEDAFDVGDDFKEKVQFYMTIIAGVFSSLAFVLGLVGVYT